VRHANVKVILESTDIKTVVDRFSVAYTVTAIFLLGAYYRSVCIYLVVCCKEGACLSIVGLCLGFCTCHVSVAVLFGFREDLTRRLAERMLYRVLLNTDISVQRQVR